MALSDDLKDYIEKNSDTKTSISEKHGVVVIGETHAPMGPPDKAAIRTNSSVRLVQELLSDPKYRYFGSEYFYNAGPVRYAVRRFLRDNTLPPQYDPATDAGLADMEKAKRLFVNRYVGILDHIRRQPVYVLSIGSSVGDSPARDVRLAQHFFEEARDRKLNQSVPGILLVGLFHAAKTPMEDWSTTRMILDKHSYQCVSVCKLTDYVPDSGTADDVVVSVDTPLDDIKPKDMIRLTSLVSKSPITFPTDRKWGTEPSPFRKVTLGHAKSSVAEQFEYVVLEKAA
ncbi:MAG TPA: hypothetical protein VMS18_13630 [Candidatus Binatia bacterium]|nr:hypothetical protein [Candidatus Binatia bacterium]